MTDDEKHIADKVAQAFRGVKLGSGIGLMEGNGLDDYADDLALKEYRSKDESDDWTRIDIDRLNRYSAGLSYMDEEGMRFHLPAYVIADLQDVLSQGDVLFHLCFLSNGAETRFDLLNEEQRDAIRQFLLLRLSDPRYSFQSSMIQNALEQYWGTSRRE